MRTKTLTQTALFVTMTVICSIITVPFVVPFTLQTFAVFLIAECVNVKKTISVILIYILLGVAGIPVFAGFKSSFSALLDITGGFIIGFVPSAALASFLVSRCKGFTARYICLIVSLLICYMFGVVWFINIYSKDITFFQAFKICILPYLLPDLIKLFIADTIAQKLKKLIMF